MKIVIITCAAFLMNVQLYTMHNDSKNSTINNVPHDLNEKKDSHDLSDSALMQQQARERQKKLGCLFCCAKEQHY